MELMNASHLFHELASSVCFLMAINLSRLVGMEYPNYIIPAFVAKSYRDISYIENKK